MVHLLDQAKGTESKYSSVQDFRDQVPSNSPKLPIGCCLEVPLTWRSQNNAQHKTSKLGNMNTMDLYGKDIYFMDYFTELGELFIFCSYEHDAMSQLKICTTQQSYHVVCSPVSDQPPPPRLWAPDITPTQAVTPFLSTCFVWCLYHFHSSSHTGTYTWKMMQSIWELKEGWKDHFSTLELNLLQLLMRWLSSRKPYSKCLNRCTKLLSCGEKNTEPHKTKMTWKVKAI